MKDIEGWILYKYGVMHSVRQYADYLQSILMTLLLMPESKAERLKG